ncbi:hypothetical protein EON65_01120 [archaeon]|nr:MAG: hypothetical protein EON65_01120 [archaeon]
MPGGKLTTDNSWLLLHLNPGLSERTIESQGQYSLGILAFSCILEDLRVPSSARNSVCEVPLKEKLIEGVQARSHTRTLQPTKELTD